MSTMSIDVKPAVPIELKESDADGNEGLIQSLARGIELLRAFGPGKDRMTIAEAARACGLTRAGARRILLTFEHLGYVRCDGRDYYLTARVLELGQGFLGQPLWQVTRPVLVSLAKTLNETVSAGVLDGDDVVYTIRARSSRMLHLELREGARLPAYASSVGRVLLASLPPAQLVRYFRHATFTKFTKFTEVDPAALRKRLDEVRAQGWCYVREEMEEGVSGVAVPLIDAAGRTAGAISAGTSPDRTSLKTVKTILVPQLREAAATIKRELEAF
jgi:IclR family transcriptional regulator, pca regulon regulatory protein